MSKATPKERHETREKLRQSIEALLANEGEIRNVLRGAAWDALESMAVGVGTLIDQIEEVEEELAAVKGEPPQTRHTRGKERRSYCVPREERRLK